ncbi:MAG: PHP domain-containing protein [Elusimicrobia bacterium]|nr:PHP domain-containing protein [Elusimicrobiota bacterium]
MTSSTCDLHTHTVLSDGTLTPEQLVQAAKEAGLSAIAVTDHDTTQGLGPAEEEGRRLGVEILPGIEMSAKTVSAKGVETDIHILGYLIRHQDARFQDVLTMLRRERETRTRKILEKLERLGIRLTMKDVGAVAGGKYLGRPSGRATGTEGGPVALGRPHIARAMVRAGYVKTFEDAFQKYLRDGGPAYVEKTYLSPAECIQMIRRIDGVAVLAHPRFGGPRGQKGWDALVKAGLDGIEAYHSQHSAPMAKSYERLALEHGLLVTGGSDFHSHENDFTGKLGDVRMPYSVIEAMRSRKASRSGQDFTLHP